MEKETASELTRWKREMTDTVFEAMVRRTIELSLGTSTRRPIRTIYPRNRKTSGASFLY